jgi:hypothetical protein
VAIDHGTLSWPTARPPTRTLLDICSDEGIAVIPLPDGTGMTWWPKGV